MARSMATAVSAFALLSVITLARAAPLGCFPEVYGRGVGREPPICPANRPALQSSSCYTNCAANYTGYGIWCTKNCPSGFTDFPPFFCQKQRASQKCPSGFNVVDAGCAKPATKRAEGVPAVCPTNKDKDDGLCFWKCRQNFVGYSRTCWKNVCPASFPFKCGLLCMKSSTTCKTISQYLTPLAVKTLANAARDYDCAARTPATWKAVIDCFAPIAADIAWAPATDVGFKAIFNASLVYCKGL